MIDRLDSIKTRFCFIASVVGFNIFQENYKFNILSYFTLFDIITYLIISVYDIQLFWGDIIRFCFCIVTFTFGIQGTVRIIIFVSKQKLIISLYEQVHEFMEKMERHMATNAIVRKFAKYMDVQTKGIIIIFYMGGAFAVSYPFFVFLFTKDVILPFGFVIPGISDIEMPGYAINYFHHVLQVILTLSGLIAVQCINIVFLLGASLMVEVLLIKLRKLKRELHAKDADNDTHREHIDMSEIIKLHQEILKYLIFYSYKLRF